MYYEYYHIESLVDRPRFTKLKPSNLVLTINNLLADLLIGKTFFRQMFETSQFAKLSLLYGSQAIYTEYYSICQS